MTDPGQDRECLRDEDVARLLEGGTDSALEALRAHLDACEECQELLALASSSTEELVIRDGDTILDRYRVVGELGRGAMGVVYRVHDPKLHRDLAVKLLHSVDASAPLRLEREAKALARLSHPNIVTVFDIGGLGDQVCMVMELVDGSSLRAWLELPRARDAIMRVFRPAGEGLHAAHQAGLVHRDFKPENVLVSADERVKIVDFGLAAADLVSAAPSSASASRLLQAHASAFHRLTRTGAVVGTPAYMAPEQFRGQEGDARSDQFAFAVCLWEALSGQHPFHATTLGELRRNVERGPAAIPDSLRHDGMTPSLLRALSVDPDARFASMADLLRALTIEDRSPAPPPSRLPRSVVWVVAVVALVAMAGAAARLVAARGPHEAPAAAAPARDTAQASSPSAPAASASAVAPAASSVAPPAPDAPLASPRSSSAPGPGAARRTSGTAVASSAPGTRAPGLAPSSVASVPPAHGPNGAPLIE